MAAAFEFIDNVGPNTVESTIRRLCKTASRVECVVAFATRAGVEAVLPFFRRVAQSGRATVVVGFYLSCTEPAALRMLLRASRSSRGRLVVRIARNPKLHRKVHVFTVPGGVALLTGSSNLTAEALRGEGESNALIRFPLGRGTSTSLRKSIPELSSPDATLPLTEELVDRYERLRRKKQGNRVSASELARLLEFTRSRSKGARPSPSRGESRWWREWIDSYTAEVTTQIVNDETGWDRRGWEWCTAQPNKLYPGDHVLLLDHTGPVPWVRVVVVKDVTRTALKTPDGRHFAAYAEQTRHYRRRKITGRFWDDLRRAGLTVRKATRRQLRTLKLGQVAAAQQVLKRRVAQ